jgi:hypothetical protein
MQKEMSEEFKQFMIPKMAMFTKNFSVDRNRLLGYWQMLSPYPLDHIKEVVDMFCEEAERLRFPLPAIIIRECKKKIALEQTRKPMIFCAWCSRRIGQRKQKCACGVNIEGLSDLCDTPFDPTTPWAKGSLSACLEAQELNLSGREYFEHKIKTDPKIGAMIKKVGLRKKIGAQ